MALFWLLARRFLTWELSTVLTIGLLLNHALLADIHVVHLAGLSFALAVLLWTSRRQNPASLFWLSATAFFVRPEFAVCLVVTGPYALILLFKAPRGWKDWLTASAIFLCLLTVGLVIISEAPKGLSRAFIAFSQQSAWAEARASGRHGVSGHFDHWARTRRIYGSAHTIPGAAMSNPVAFAEHLLRNAASLPSKVLWTLLPGGPGAPVAPFTFLVAYAIALLLGEQKRAPPASFRVAGTGFALSVLAAGLLFRADPIYLLAGIRFVAAREGEKSHQCNQTPNHRGRNHGRGSVSHRFSGFVHCFRNHERISAPAECSIHGVTTSPWHRSSENLRGSSHFSRRTVKTLRLRLLGAARHRGDARNSDAPASYLGEAGAWLHPGSRGI